MTVVKEARTALALADESRELDGVEYLIDARNALEDAVSGLLEVVARVTDDGMAELIAQAIHDGPEAQKQYAAVGIAPHDWSSCRWQAQYRADAAHTLALLRGVVGPDEAGSAEDASRECGSCGDEAATLSSRDRCDGCEALPECVECREPVADGGPDELEHGMCGSCLHNALRSGWEPGR